MQPVGPISNSGNASNESRDCRVCGGEIFFALVARERMFGMKGEFEYFECRDCGGLQIKAIPDELEAYYREDYYTHEIGEPGVRSANAIGRAWTSFRLRPGAIRRIVSGRRYARFEWFRRTSTKLDDPILDVGCGSGRLLRRMARSGFEDLTGIDVDWKGASQFASGLRFERATPETHVGRYRLVMAHHSFEHMRDPAASFAAMSRLVEPDGHLLVRVPRADSWARRHYGADWVQLDAPRHLHVPTRRGLEGLAHANGMRVVGVEDDSGPFQIWGSELYRMGLSLTESDGARRRRPALRARAAARWRSRKLSRQGLGDQACFYFRRESAAQEARSTSESSMRGSVSP